MEERDAVLDRSSRSRKVFVNVRIAVSRILPIDFPRRFSETRGELSHEKKKERNNYCRRRIIYGDDCSSRGGGVQALRLHRESKLQNYSSPFEVRKSSYSSSLPDKLFRGKLCVERSSSRISSDETPHNAFRADEAAP